MPAYYPHRLCRLLVVCLSCVVWLLLAGQSFAEDAKEKSPPPFPTDPKLWLNTTPLTWEQLSGKGVVLCYFWCDPEVNKEVAKVIEVARSRTADPVILIGVSMGYTRPETETFVKATGFQWPVLCDPVFAFTHLSDKALESKETDLLSECSFAIENVTPKGVLEPGDWEDPSSAF